MQYLWTWGLRTAFHRCICRDVYDVFSYKLVYAYLGGLSNFYLIESE